MGGSRMMNPGSAKAIDVINRFTHTGDYAGKPFDLRPWQRKIVGDLSSSERMLVGFDLRSSSP